jgi:cytochrome c-type biogenesis protein CcmH/NrfG
MESMERQYSKKTLVFSAVGFFVGGLLVGGLLTRAFLSAASPQALLDISAQLKEAHALLDKNVLADAERSYLAVLGRDPGNPEALSHLGNVAFQQGDIERALRFYDMALQQDSSYAHALWDKGIALRAKGDNAGAVKAWEAFVRLFPPDSSDVVQVKKWIAEAQAPLGSAPTGSETKGVFRPPPEAFLRGKSSK